MSNDKRYRLLKKYETPFWTYHIGVIKNTTEWKRVFPQIIESDFDIKDDWFELIPEQEERIKIGKMSCSEGEEGYGEMKWNLNFKTNKHIHYDKAVELCNLLERYLNGEMDNPNPTTEVDKILDIDEAKHVEYWYNEFKVASKSLGEWIEKYCKLEKENEELKGKTVSKEYGWKDWRTISKGVSEPYIWLTKEQLDAMMRNVWNAAREESGKSIGRIETDEGDCGFYYNKKYLTFEDYKNTLPENKASNTGNEIKDNVIENLNDDLWCVHKYLDDLNVPRHDSKQQDYSIVGRIKLLRLDHLKELSKLESEILLKSLSGPKEEELKDWEILSFKHSGGFGDTFFNLEGNKYKCDKYPSEEFEIDCFLNNSIGKIYTIHSVKRKDGVIFSANEVTDQGVIKSFELCGNYMMAMVMENIFININNLNKIILTTTEQTNSDILFTTEQYKEIWDMIFSQTGFPPNHPKTKRNK